VHRRAGPQPSACAGRLARGRVRPPVRLRPEVGDDGRGPPVGDCDRSAAEVGRSWAKTASGLRAVEKREAGCALAWAGREGEWVCSFLFFQIPISS
jgi:hypothetical protein